MWIIKMIFWFLIMVAVFAYAVMLLWNWLIPELFRGNPINFWQALGLMALSKLLIGFGTHSAGHFKSKFMHKYSSLPEHEKEELRQKFKDRWCKPPEEEENS